MTGHTIRNTANQEAGYEGYQHEDPTSIRHKIGLGAVYQRLTTTFGAALLSSNTVTNGTLIQTNRTLSPIDSPHNSGSFNFDVVIMNLTLCNISDFDEQVIVEQDVQLQDAKNLTGSIGLAAPMPSQFWVPKGTTFTLYNKNTPYYFLREKTSQLIRFKTANNPDSIDLVCHYALIDQEND